jgi:hypothetical protein
MTHADIVAWWAVGIAAVAILAHIPLTMLSHHYLPKVEDFFAAHSKEKLTKRIAKLKRRLDQLNDPRYIEDLAWDFREQLFVIMYLFGVGLASEAGILFVATGAVAKTWFWQAPPTWPLSGRLPVFVIFFLLSGVFLAGRNMFRSASLKPSKRPKLISDVQSQIDALKNKLDKFPQDK